jgi:hypothetical protein
MSITRNRTESISLLQLNRKFILVAALLALISDTAASQARGAAPIAAPELPRVVPESGDPYPGRPCSVTLGARADITVALKRARGGTVVCLTSRATYGPFQLPSRASNDTGWIVLRTNTTKPNAGTRIRPSTAGGFAKVVQSRNAEPAVTTGTGAMRYVLQGFEITVGPSVSQTYTLVELGKAGRDQDNLSEVPSQLILSHMYIHGSTTGEMQRCVALNSGATAIVDSWLGECHGKGYDSQAIVSWNGPGPHLVRNNHLEGAGENVMWGGATPSIPNLVAADITFQRNYVYTPLSWKGRWTKKNLFELKNAVRVLVEDNVFDGSWTDGQTGPALVFKSINDEGNCNWCRTTDVTVRRSYVTHAGAGIVFSGAENYSGGKVDTVARRFLIQDVVFDSLNVPPYAGAGRAVQIGGGASDIVLDRTVTTGNIGNAMILDNFRPSPRTAFRNSVWAHGYYFAASEGTGMGLPTMLAGLRTFGWQRMTIVRGATLDPLPEGTTVVTNERAAPLAAQIRATVANAVRGVVLPD